MQKIAIGVKKLLKEKKNKALEYFLSKKYSQTFLQKMIENPN